MTKIRDVTEIDEVLKMDTLAMQFGPGFPVWLGERADHLEIWGTTLLDNMTDTTEFRLMAGEIVIARRRVDGY